MLKKIVRMGLPLAVALGLALPFVNAISQEQKEPQKTEKNKKRTEKGKGKTTKRKAEQPKAQ